MKRLVSICVFIGLFIASCTADVVTDPLESSLGDNGDTRVDKIAKAVTNCAQFTATNDQHVAAGRAYKERVGFLFFPTNNYYAVGTDDSLGSSGTITTTLFQIDEGAFSTSNTLCPAVSPDAEGTTGTAKVPHCLDNITDFDSDGPFRYTKKSSGLVNMYIPNVPAGCKVPMVHHANGTGGSCMIYASILTRLASHGFIALCYESTNTGSGEQGITAFETALREYPNLADLKFGSTGHSQGGQSSFIVLQNAEDKWGNQGVYAGLAQEPASGFGVQPPLTTWQAEYRKIKSPMFMFSGLGTDGLVAQTWVQSAFDALSASTEAYFWAKTGATHIPTPNGETQEISVPWFRWKLLGDKKACEYFRKIPNNNPLWIVVEEQNQRQCI